MIEVNENIKIKIFISKAYSGYFSSYKIIEFKNCQPYGMIAFNQWDDYSFQAYLFDSNFDDINSINFIIKKDNPFYNSLNKFLNKDDLIIIDDDDTSEINKKLLQISRSQEEIIVSFSNELGKNEYEKFNVFVKNIATDYRSKIDSGDFDTKDRLYRLFENFREDFCPETLEEYPIKSEQIIMERTYSKNLIPNNIK